MRIIVYLCSLLILLTTPAGLTVAPQGTLPRAGDDQIEVWFLEPVNKDLFYDFDLEQRSYVMQAARPLVAASTLNHGLRILIEEGQDINAAVLISGQINIFSQLLFFGATPYPLQALLAHEISHATKNHFLLFTEDTAAQSVISTINLFAGLALSAALMFHEDSAELARPLLLGTLISTRHNFARGLVTSIRRGEQAADLAALNLMEKANLNTTGLAELFNHFDLLSPAIPAHLQPWLTHPNPQDRLRSVDSRQPNFDQHLALNQLDEKFAQLEKRTNYDQQSKQLMALARTSYTAKQLANNRKKWQQFVTSLDTSFPHQYGLLVGLITQKNYQAGLRLVDQLLATNGDHFLLVYQKARLLLATKQPAAASKLFATLHQSNRQEPAYKLYLAQAYLADPATVARALPLLEGLTFGDAIDPQVAYTSWTLLQRYHKQDGKPALAGASFALALFAEVTRDLEILFTSSAPPRTRRTILTALARLNFIIRFLANTSEAVAADTPYGRKIATVAAEAATLTKSLRALAI